MANKHANLDSLFNDIADAIREKIGDESIIPAVDFPDLIRDRLQVIKKPYLTFKSLNSFTLKVNDTTKHWNGTLEYSTNASTWSTWDGTTALSSATKGSSNVLYLRGTGNTVITGSSSNYRWVLTGNDIKCIGNIENLLDYATVTAGNHPTMANDCYSYMFYGCTSLTQAPALPATTLAQNCYHGIFNGCTSLTQAPALPATTLAYQCYYGMFYSCTSLTQAPNLPATMLADDCYQYMFYDCTSLTQAPALPATTLADTCYGYMFKGCTALTQAPALPATTLENYCYQNMFSGCTSLTKAPALPATTLSKFCYSNMFQGCTSLTQVPALPAATLADYCYRSMFQKCSKIKLSSTQTGEYTQEYRIPTSGTGTTATNALTDMFTGTGGTFTGTPEINTTYYLSNTNEVIGGPIVVDITASNISEYFTVTNGSSYYFNGQGNVFTTNNTNVSSSTASTTLTAKQDISEISFDYSYSSEPSYDKFTLKVAGSIIENAVSGATTIKSYKGSLSSGQTIEFKYVKDSSVDKNDDKCTFSNMVIKLG